MIRNVLSVIVGYAAMVAMVLLGLATAYTILGADGAFEPRLYLVTTTWLIVAWIVYVMAAIVAGIICKAIARTTVTPFAFALIVCVVGFALAIAAMTAGDTSSASRQGDVAMFDAMMNAKQPLLFYFVNPVIAAAGILIGGALVPTFRRSASVSTR